MFNQPQKTNNYKGFLPIVIFLVPALVSAFSLSGFLKVFGTTTKDASISNNTNENLQNLKVFETKKAFAEGTGEQIDTQNTKLKEADNSFVVDETLIDATDTENLENHSENAIYTVQKNDSIYSIASYFGVSVQTIVTFNHMKNKEVHVGDVLEVPSVSGVLYEIRKGDTLAGLAKKYSVDLDDVTLYNGLLPSDDLAVGDEVFLPGAKEVEVVKTGTKTSTKVVKASRSTRGQWANGDTAHLNTSGDIAKYSSLPKYAGYYMMPVPGAVRTQKLHGHNGVDLAAPIGSTVVASAGGVVRVAKNSGYNFGLGNYIIISHDNGTETVYGHLLHADVSAGQTVARGQAIGRLGSSGNSTGPHTHFEIHGAYNPFAW